MPPLELDHGSAPVRVDEIFRDAVSRVLDIHLNDDRPVAVEVRQKGIDAAVEFGSGVHFSVLERRRSVNAHDVLTYDNGNPTQRGAHRKRLPVLRGDEGRAERTRHDGNPAARLDLTAERGFDVDVWEDAVIWVGRHVLPKPVHAVCVALYAQCLISDLLRRHVRRTGRG